MSKKKQNYWPRSEVIFFAAGAIVVPLLLVGGTLVHTNLPAHAVLGALQYRPPVSKLPEALVQITRNSGHGSGVHLGNGLILTAAHVVDKVSEENPVTVVTNQGGKLKAQVLWATSDYDVALLRVHKLEANKLTLDCSKLKVGEPVMAKGFPLDFGRVEFRGHVGSATKQIGHEEGAHWREANIIDMTAAVGLSGGPIVSRDTGKLRGMVSGMFTVQANPFAPPLPSGIMIAVPSSTICNLMANGGA